MRALSYRETRTLAALFDAIIPPGESLGGWAGGGSALIASQWEGFLADSQAQLVAAIKVADKADKDGRSFAALNPKLQGEILRRIYSEEEVARSLAIERSSLPPLSRLVELVHEAYYAGTSHPTGWEIAGYAPRPPQLTIEDPAPLAGSEVNDIAAAYDVIVIGSGAGGGVAASALAARGKTVLLLERAPAHADRDLRDNHLQGKRAELYSVVAGPDPSEIRLLAPSDGPVRELRGDGPGSEFGLVAMALGGGTRLWQGMAWRFMREDFAMRTIYGRPDQSTLADWPITYEDLVPYYERIESDLGVSGDADELSIRYGRLRPLPMPALPDPSSRAQFHAAAERLGWSTTHIPFAINSINRGNRRACVACAQCVGHACPVNARNGTHNTVIPRAVEQHGLTLLHSAKAVRILTDRAGRAHSVALVHRPARGDARQLVVRAKQVVVAAGAIETTRLLLASGLGNRWVGSNHHSHGFASATSLDGRLSKSYEGPGHSIATLDFVHHNAAPWGGGVIFDLSAPLPISKAVIGREVVAPFGEAHTRWMRDAPLPYGVMSMVQEVPHDESRIGLDRSRVDEDGMPLVRLGPKAHPASERAAAFMRDRCTDWMTATGASRVRSVASGGGSRGAEHSAGTARWGLRADDSACDAEGRLWGTPNVYIADASLLPTNGGFNPGLTIMACALRVAELMP